MKRNLAIFISICLFLSFISAGIFSVLGMEYNSNAGMLFCSAYMLVPALSVFLTQLICGEKVFRGLGLSFKFNWWWIAGWLLMPVFSLLSLFASTLLPGISFSTEGENVMNAVKAINSAGLKTGPVGLIFLTVGSGLIAGISINAIFALGEEIAWRGYLVKCLDGMGFWKKSLVIGLLWGIWHAPIILMGHNYPEHPTAGVFMMVALCTALSPVLLLLREKSGSVILPAIAHGTLNATTGLSVIYLSGFNDLLAGPTGLIGILILLVTDALIFLEEKKHDCPAMPACPPEPSETE